MKNNNLNDHIEKILDEGKAEDIISIPLKGKSSLADYMIIASGTSTRHVTALSNQITSKLKIMGFKIPSKISFFSFYLDNSSPSVGKFSCTIWGRYCLFYRYD